MKYKLYTIDNQKRSKVKGFWLDNKGKVYIDNVIIKSYSQRGRLEKEINTLFNKGEKSVFYAKEFWGDNRDCWGYCRNEEGKTEIYPYRLIFKRLKLSKIEIKNLLHKYGGLTIYNCKKTIGLYFIEVFYK